MGHARQKLVEAHSLSQRSDPAGACQILRDLLSDTEVAEAAAVSLIQMNSFEDFRRAVDTLMSATRRPDAQHEALVAYAYACFALGEANESIRASRAAIITDPDDHRPMTTLGMALLLAGQHLDAFLAFGPANRPWRMLASCLMRGRHIQDLEFDGVPYRFHLRTETPQMMEAALIHLSGTLAEDVELRAIGQNIGRCETVVEVGTCVGNHLLFFLKVLRPTRALVFDYDPRCIATAKANVGLNAISPEAVTFRQVAIGAKAGFASGPDGQPIDAVSLDEALDAPVDFVKIDVDGLELAVLDGAKRVLREHKPRIMVEVARVNEDGFALFLNDVSYRVVGAVDRRQYKNYLIAPR